MRGIEVEQINIQELSIPGQGDLLQEDEYPLYWDLKIGGAGHQRELEHCRGLKLWSPVDDQFALLIPLRTNREAVV